MAATVESVLTQTYDNVEYIIIDGGSTDGTIEVIRRYEHAVDYWISEPDKGIGDAFNKGVLASTGMWVNFMNCGDRFASPRVIDWVKDHMDKNADIIFGKATVVDERGVPLVTCGRPFEDRALSRRMSIPHQSAFHNRQYFRDYGLFDTDLKTSMVYELVLRKRSLAAIFVDEVMSYMLPAGISETADYLRLREAKRIKQEHRPDLGFLAIQFDYYYGLMRAVMKRALIRVGLTCVARRVRRIEARLRQALT
ncbi:MAG: glycosyltransferase [Candidatus Coatesbacteria bacterium]|nr:glycosyltransferase [Candidatus Coatesbacteria bacterium]